MLALQDNWQQWAVNRLLDERSLAPPTPLRELVLPALAGRRLMFKDESLHASGSLKHRLARSLFLQGLRSGAIRQHTPLFDASSGNTAVSEAWFAHLLGLQYFAVIPESTSPGKQALIERYGGECVRVPRGQCCKQHAAQLAREQKGYFLDQFTNAAIAVDWQEHNVIAELFTQLRERELSPPDWFVTGAGTGGTATCAGRYFHGTDAGTRVLVVDPEDSAYFDFHACGKHPGGCLCASRVEGIGRPTVEPSFHAVLVDRMLTVPDSASFAAALWLSEKLGQRVGVSTGTNLIGAIELLQQGERSVVTLICDDGERYAGCLDNTEWLSAQRLDVAPWQDALDAWFKSGRWTPPQSPKTGLHAVS